MELASHSHVIMICWHPRIDLVGNLTVWSTKNLSVVSNVASWTLFDLVEAGSGFASALSSSEDLSMFLVDILFFFGDPHDLAL